MDTYPGELRLMESSSAALLLRVPDDAQLGQTIQLVFEATDDGRPALTRYARLVVSVTR